MSRSLEKARKVDDDAERRGRRSLNTTESDRRRLGSGLMMMMMMMMSDSCKNSFLGLRVLVWYSVFHAMSLFGLLK